MESAVTPLPPLPATVSAVLRVYLYFTAAVAGAAVMIVEILGAKMLAPYFGTSHFVWTGQIAVTLVALAVGYYAGGRLADRSPRPGRMYGNLIAAAAYLSLTTLYVERVSYACLQHKLAVGSLLASAYLFFLPLALLAMTGPFFVRLLTVAVAGVGGSVGRLSAVSTMGSFIGTVLIGYVLVPYLRNSVTMYLTASALVAVSVVYFVIWGRATSRVVATVGAAMALALGGAGVIRDGRAWDGSARQLFRANSNFGELWVIEDEGTDRRSYLNDFLTQNTYDPVLRQSTSMFTYALHGLACAYSPEPSDVLCIGMGAGIVPMEFARDGARVDVVEINAAVVPMATQFFDFEPARMHVVIGDGRQYLNATKNRYDAIILDAFLGDSSPSHLMSREAFAAMRRALKPGGVLVINSFCDFEPGDDFFGGSLDKTLRSVFEGVRIHAAGNGNVFFVASDHANMAVMEQPDFEAMHHHSRATVREAFGSLVEADPASGIVLTDDYNPIEFYDAANREEYRRLTAESMRRH